MAISFTPFPMAAPVTRDGGLVSTAVAGYFQQYDKLAPGTMLGRSGDTIGPPMALPLGTGPAEVTVANLPASPVIGQIANVSDSSVSTWGGIVAGGGSAHVGVRWNGTAWTVFAL